MDLLGYILTSSLARGATLGCQRSRHGNIINSHADWQDLRDDRAVLGSKHVFVGPLGIFRVSRHRMPAAAGFQASPSPLYEMNVAAWVALLAVAEGKWCYSQTQCQSILGRNAKDADAWLRLGFYGGGRIHGVTYTKMQCYEKSAELKPETPDIWYNIGNHGGGHVGGKHLTPKACYEKALVLNPKYANAWNNLGHVGGGHVQGKHYTEIECYQVALSLNPEYPDAWWNLGVLGGGTFGGQQYSAEESYKKANHFYKKQLDVKLARLPKSVSSTDFRAVAVEVLEGGSKGHFEAQMKAAFEACHPESGECLPKAQAMLSYWPGELARKLPEVPAEVTTVIVKGMVTKLTAQCEHEGFSQEALTKIVCHAQQEWTLEHGRRLAAGRRLLGNPCASSMERLFEEFATEFAGRGRSRPCHLGAAKRTCTPLAHGMSGRPFIDRLDRHQPELAALCHRPVRLEDRVGVGCKPCAGRR